eukprot:scaffold256267_cov12-Tisochrysis_lutea.AAC.1
MRAEMSQACQERKQASQNGKGLRKTLLHTCWICQWRTGRPRLLQQRLVAESPLHASKICKRKTERPCQQQQRPLACSGIKPHGHRSTVPRTCTKLHAAPTQATTTWPLNFPGTDHTARV